MGDSPGKNTGVGCHALLQGVFPNQGWKPGLPHFKQILYQLSHERSPIIRGWVAYPFSRGSSQPRNQTWVSRIACRLSTSWATREAHWVQYLANNSYGVNGLRICRDVLKSWLEPSQCKKIDYLGLLLKFIGGREQKKLPALQLTRMITIYPRENLNSRHLLNSLGVLKIVDNNDAYLWSGEDRLLLGNFNQLGDQ